MPLPNLTSSPTYASDLPNSAGSYASALSSMSTVDDPNILQESRAANSLQSRRTSVSAIPNSLQPRESHISSPLLQNGVLDHTRPQTTDVPCIVSSDSTTPLSYPADSSVFDTMDLLEQPRAERLRSISDQPQFTPHLVKIKHQALLRRNSEPQLEAPDHETGFAGDDYRSNSVGSFSDKSSTPI